jgi:hypothetical protein
VLGVETSEDITKLSLRTQVQKDEQVNELSQDIQSLLVKNGYITNTSDVVEQSIT